MLSIIDCECNNEIKKLHCEREDYVKAVCGYSPCMLGELAYKYCNCAQKNGGQIVDMETVYCARVALNNGCRFMSWVVISDIPGKINFWELSQNDEIKFKNAKNHVISDIVKYVSK